MNTGDNTTMENLIELCKNYHTDKDTVHSYITNFYDKNFEKYKDTAKTVLEIGIDVGGSCRLWKKYFCNAEIYAIDVRVQDDNLKILQQENIKVFIENAYTQEMADKIPELDIAIDDGPHTLYSMTEFIRLYLPKIKSGGILIVEDIQDPNWFEDLKRMVPEEYQNYIEFVDTRHLKNRYDDVLFVVRIP